MKGLDGSRIEQYKWSVIVGNISDVIFTLGNYAIMNRRRVGHQGGGTMQEIQEGRLASKKEKNLQWLRRFCLMDDMFLSVIFQRRECTELLLRLILKREDLIVEKVRTQRDMKNLWGRSARLDILAVDKNGKYYNIEVQRKDEGANPRRARYYSALLDTNITEPGENFEHLAETYVIFITENDVLGLGEPLYHINRFIEEAGALFQDDAHIIYVNSKIQDETALGKLMYDMYCIDPDDMNYKILADEVRYYKEDTKGVKVMCKIMEEILDEGRERGRLEGRLEGRAEGRTEGRKEGEIKQAQEIGRAHV